MIGLDIEHDITARGLRNGRGASEVLILMRDFTH